MILQSSMSIVAEQRMKLAMTPELIIYIELLQLSVIDLTRFLEEKWLENPLLEIDYQIESDKQYIDDYPTDFKSSAFQYDIEAVEMESYSDFFHLCEEQLCNLVLDPLTYRVCHYLIGNLDEKGYLISDPEYECQRFQIDSKYLQACIEIIHSMDPAGIGARSTTECIQIQLRRKKNPNQLAIKLVKKYLHQLAKGKIRAIAKSIGIDIAVVQEAIDEIKSCYPLPMVNFAPNRVRYIQPDVVVEKIENNYKVSLNNPNFPSLKINKDYRQLIKERDLYETDVRHYLKHYLGSAIGLMKGIEQRKKTIYRVAEAIVENQQAFFRYGPQFLQPLTLKEIAEQLSLHESTISRVTQQKYMQTPYGVYPLRSFFPKSLLTATEENLSVGTIKSKIREIIEKEDLYNPLSDQKIANRLQYDGIHIFRRTVAKYRKELGFPSSIARRRY